MVTIIRVFQSKYDNPKEYLERNYLLGKIGSLNIIIDDRKNNMYGRHYNKPNYYEYTQNNQKYNNTYNNTNNDDHRNDYDNNFSFN